MTKLALGLMSGTSADGLTVCAVHIHPFKIIHFKNYSYPKKLQSRLLNAYQLNAAPLSELNYELGALYAKLVKRFLKEFKLSANSIEVIGSHGQTVLHAPHATTPHTLQIAEPGFLAAQLGVPVVSDFRAKDIALGGQGAPLVPFFDEAFFMYYEESDLCKRIYNAGSKIKFVKAAKIQHLEKKSSRTFLRLSMSETKVGGGNRH